MTKRGKLYRWGFGPLLGVLLGAGYGVFMRVLPDLTPRGGNTFSSAVLVMTIAFLAFVPLAVGYLTVSVGQVCGLLRVPLSVTAILLTVGTAYLTGKEGAICVVMGLPIMLVFAIVGGLLAPRNGKPPGLKLAFILMAPVIGGPMEVQFTPPLEYRTVRTEVRIDASPAVVWREIERVRPIARGELRDTWAQRIGFPRPVEATLSREGVGGVRHATFERGLMFVETVTAWEPERRLGFGIRADTEHIPPTTLDEHVRIGGRYFDVLNGEYRIEPLAAGGVVLHLESREQVSTDFNWYAGWWSDAVMRALQGSILEVIRKRCEAEAGR